ncbi:alpha/beta fold hydrolase [Kribbella sp. NPDC056951]|uniref:alpha/beta fold hydrolase n=1 Tax=Kribbella sp. NPDC056951 TaxID=3345978 RepID=UPI0036336F9E
MTPLRKRRYRRIALASAGVLLALALIDSLIGALVYKTGTEAHVSVIPARDGQNRRAIVVLPGYVMSGSVVGRAFRPFVAGTDALVSVDYPQTGLDTSEIYRQVEAALQELAPSEVVFYGASMGGMVAAQLLRQYEAEGARYGRPTLVLDTAPAAYADVKRPDWLFKVACWYRGGPIAALVWAAGTALVDTPPTGAGADPQLVRRGHRAGTWVGGTAAASQGCFIGRFELGSGDAATTGDLKGIFYLHATSSEQDPLINTSTAINRWRNIFPSLADVVVEGRQGGWHIPLVERPEETATALLSVLER